MSSNNHLHESNIKSVLEQEFPDRSNFNLSFSGSVATPRSLHGSPRIQQSLGGDSDSNAFSKESYSDEFALKWLGLLGVNKKELRKVKRKGGGRVWYQRKRVKGLLCVIGLIGLFFFVNWLMLSRLQDHGVVQQSESPVNSSSVSGSISIQVCFFFSKL